MAELKPCPFCGGEARRFKSEVFFYGITCIKCNAKISGRANEASATRAWNRRAKESERE